MEKKDFSVGKHVFVYLVGNAARYITDEKRIQEWEIVTVGRKYITAKPIGKNKYCEEKFDIQDDFRHVTTCGGASYVLYLSLKDLNSDIEKNSFVDYIIQKMNKTFIRNMEYDDVKIINDIVRKYV